MRSLTTLLAGFWIVLCLQLGAAERRCAFDIGSGQIKMQISDVEEGKILNILTSTHVWMPLREDLAHNHNDMFSEEIQLSLIKTIQDLLKKGEVFHPDRAHAIATEPFRIAKNAQEVITRVKKETGLDITVITQEEEGILGFLSAINEAKIDPDHVVVWDFGGGSFQLSTRMGEDYVVYQSKLGRVPFRNAVLDIQGKNLKDTFSPNPIGVQVSCKAIEYVDKCLKDLPETLREKIKKPSTTILGIGINPLWIIRVNCYSRLRVLSEYLQRIHLTDAEIIQRDSLESRNEYPFIPSNLLLAYSIMKNLQIKKVLYVGTPSANAIGLLLTERYWSPANVIPFPQ